LTTRVDLGRDDGRIIAANIAMLPDIANVVALNLDLRRPLGCLSK
jgi:hypothetical protein